MPTLVTNATRGDASFRDTQGRDRWQVTKGSGAAVAEIKEHYYMIDSVTDATKKEMARITVDEAVIDNYVGQFDLSCNNGADTMTQTFYSSIASTTITSTAISLVGTTTHTGDVEYANYNLKNINKILHTGATDMSIEMDFDKGASAANAALTFSYNDEATGANDRDRMLINSSSVTVYDDLVLLQDPADGTSTATIRVSDSSELQVRSEEPILMFTHNAAQNAMVERISISTDAATADIQTSNANVGIGIAPSVLFHVGGVSQFDGNMDMQNNNVNDVAEVTRTASGKTSKVVLTGGASPTLDLKVGTTGSETNVVAVTEAGGILTGAFTVTSNLTVQGNLDVTGAVISTLSQTVTVQDKNIVLAYDAANNAALNGGGITLGNNGTTSEFTMLYDNGTGRWDFNVDVNVDSGLALRVNDTDAVLSANTLSFNNGTEVMSISGGTFQFTDSIELADDMFYAVDYTNATTFDVYLAKDKLAFSNDGGQLTYASSAFTSNVDFRLANAMHFAIDYTNDTTADMLLEQNLLMWSNNAARLAWDATSFTMNEHLDVATGKQVAIAKGSSGMILQESGLQFSSASAAVYLGGGLTGWKLYDVSGVLTFEFNGVVKFEIQSS